VVEAPEGLSLEAFAERARRLPAFARPCFVRVTRGLSLTASLKLKKAEWARQGVDPESVSDPVYYLSGARYLRLETDDYRRIVTGQQRF
jgi:fatty-acyl-CoA synthase